MVIRDNYKIRLILIIIQKRFFVKLWTYYFNFLSIQNSFFVKLKTKCYNFQSNQNSFFYFFCFSIYKIVDCEYNTGDYKSSKISIGAVIKNPERLKFVPDHRKTKNTCKHAVKRLPFVTRYVPKWYKTQQMCDKAILENGGTL